MILNNLYFDLNKIFNINVFVCLSALCYMCFYLKIDIILGLVFFEFYLVSVGLYISEQYNTQSLIFCGLFS